MPITSLGKIELLTIRKSSILLGYVHEPIRLESNNFSLLTLDFRKTLHHRYAESHTCLRGADFSMSLPNTQVGDSYPYGGHFLQEAFILPPCEYYEYVLEDG